MATPAHHSNSNGLSSTVSSSLSSSDSSISSLNNCYTMEPLVIEEDVDVRQLNVVEEEAAVEVELVAPTTQPRSQSLIGDRIVEETEEDMVEEMKEIIIVEGETTNAPVRFRRVKRLLAIRPNKISLVDYKTKALVRSERMTDLKSWFSGNLNVCVGEMMKFDKNY